MRLSGGRIAAEQLEILALAAEELGDGAIEFTIRGNLQVRGIADDDVDDFAERLVQAGLVGSAAHDKIRNIAVSPFAGRIAHGESATDALWRAADELGQLLAASSEAHRLSGRFWFGFDDGSGDIAARTPDLLGRANGEHVALVVDGREAGDVPVEQLAPVMHAVAVHFLALRSDEWRIRDLPDVARDELHRGARQLTASPAEPSAPAAADDVAPRVGWFTQDDGRVLLGAVLPFGRLTSRQAQFAAAIGAPLLVTPDRELLIADLDEAVAETVVRVLAPLGFSFDSNSPWTRMSACTGSPGCASSRADVRGLLVDYLSSGPDVDGLEIEGREHWVGCERGCGAPPRARVRVHPENGADVR